MLVACTLLAAALSWVLPAGRYDRRSDPATGRDVVVPGSYHAVPRTPVGPFDAFVAIPKGMTDAADVIFYVFLVGGAFAVVERTGSLRRMVDVLSGAGRWVIPLACLLFGLGGYLIQMQEELIAFVPVLLLLTRRLGYQPVVAVAMSLGAAAVGAAFSGINPFQVGIAQKVAQLPLGSGSGFRLAVLAPAALLWIGATMRHARRTATAPAADATIPADAAAAPAVARRQTTVLILVLAAFALFVYGVETWEWGFAELGALFFLMGVAAGLVGGLRVGGTVEAFVEGFRIMAFAALLIGFARAITITLAEGQVLDTIVHGLAAPLGALPMTAAAVAMMATQALIHVPVPSTSGQAVLTLPVLVPVSDLIGLSRQVTVLAYQYGAGLTELVTPTNGALMAMLAASGVRYDTWMRFLLPVVLGLVALAAVALVIAIRLGL